MAVLVSSRRTLDRATYVPMKPRRLTHIIPGRAWDKWSYVAALAPSREEVARVSARLAAGATALTDADRQGLATLDTGLAPEGEAASASLPLEAAPHLHAVATELLARFGEALLEVRREALAGALADAKALRQARDEATGGEAIPTGRSLPQGFALDAAFVRPGWTGAQLFRRHETRPLAGPPPVAPPVRPGMASPALLSSTVSDSVLLVRPPAPTRVRHPTGPADISQLVAWARQTGAHPQQTERLAKAERRWLGGGGASVAQLESVAALEMARLRDLTHHFRQRIATEPVGLLHLERLSFIPAGIERGELVYAVPLSPGEVVNLTHKEWSNTSEEFHRIVTDFLEEFSEEGVTEKSELAQSTQSQHQHSLGFNMSVTASGGFGPVSVSASTGLNLADSTSQSQTTSRNQSHELTRKASARSRREHKVSFKVASAAGTEDQAVRII
ncbi:MAG TPA: hypothetical protein VGV61_01795, partial [Thermoanaerobaculia bacterium]|nr:hypothetical protein [Thermoanaerobaculia bacterium]